MIAVAVVLFLIAVLGFVLGMIKPSLVIWWGTSKSRGKVVLVCGLIFVVSIILAVVGAPGDLEAGKTALAQANYKEAVEHLAAVKPSDQGYSEAQRLLPDAKNKFSLSKLKAAEAADAAGDHAKVVALLTDYPPDAPGSVDAAKMLMQSKDALAAADSERQDREAKRAAEAQAEKAQRDAQEQREAIAREQERAMADFPECGSDDAAKEVAHTMENAPLGRVYGLSVIKITDTRQITASPASRNCAGTALLNNAQSYPITYRFYRDGNDIMVEADVQGLGDE